RPVDPLAPAGRRVVGALPAEGGVEVGVAGQQVVVPAVDEEGAIDDVGRLAAGGGGAVGDDLRAGRVDAAQAAGGEPAAEVVVVVLGGVVLVEAARRLEVGAADQQAGGGEGGDLVRAGQRAVVAVRVGRDPRVERHRRLLQTDR